MRVCKKKLDLLRRIVALAIGVTLTACGVPQQPQKNSVEEAFHQKQSNVQVSGTGRVDRILSDDTSGLPHQRFVVRTASDQTVLIEHNTDVARRVDGLKVGETVSFSGEYIWNDQGGLVHWTHHDPEGRHVNGWIEYGGRRYE